MEPGGGPPEGLEKFTKFGRKVIMSFISVRQNQYWSDNDKAKFFIAKLESELGFINKFNASKFFLEVGISRFSHQFLKKSLIYEILEYLDQEEQTLDLVVYWVLKSHSLHYTQLWIQGFFCCKGNHSGVWKFPQKKLGYFKKMPTSKNIVNCHYYVFYNKCKNIKL